MENGYFRSKSRDVWRHNCKYDSPDMATVSSFVIRDEDTIIRVGDITIVICHVEGFHGKGFVAALRHLGGGETSKIFYGTDQSVYDKAVRKGCAMYSRELTRSRELWNRIRATA